MAPTTPKAAPADAAAAYTMPPALRAAMATLSAALDARAQSDDAIARNGEMLRMAEAELLPLSEKQEQLDLKVALETDAMRSEELEDAADDVRRSVEDSEKKVARFRRTGINLSNKATEDDAAIAAARHALKVEKEIFGRQCLEALDAEMATALAALAPALARVHALREMQVIGWGAAILQDVHIPGPHHAAGNLLWGSRMRLPSGDVVDLASGWRQFADRTTSELMEGDLVDLERRAAAHQPFIPPSKGGEGQMAAVYKPNEQNVRASERNRAIEAREAARAAAEPPKPGWSGQSWRGNVG